MRWQLKAAVQRVLSALPASERANYVLQRRVTRSLPCPEDVLLARFDESVLHVRHFHEHAARDGPRGVRAYEFGAGWDLIGPLAFRMLGVERQVLVDIRPSLRPELVEDTLRRFAELHPELERRAGRPLPRLGRSEGASLPELLARFGIEYLAPCDARATGLPAASFDLISSTYTLEHVPPEDILAILRECRRLLAPGGVLSCSIDLQDHYAFDDPRISVYNFLRYSERTWRLVNSSLHHQNRLRMPDHIALLEEAGLTVRAARSHTPDAPQLAPVHPELAGRHAPEELAVTALVVAATAPTSVQAPRIPQRVAGTC